MATQQSKVTEVATKVVLSYPADLSDWGRWQLDERSFKSYLQKTKGEIAEGDEWEVFLDVGCCGNTLDVPLRIESIDGTPVMGENTTIEYVEREACGIEGGWKVQSEGAPTDT
ncbi:MAG: hypothetical protein ABEI06_01885 [Halobacteriaceae archaeon]